MALISVLKLVVPTLSALNILEASVWLVATRRIHQHVLRSHLGEDIRQAGAHRLVHGDGAAVGATCSAWFNFLYRLVSPFDHAYVTLLVHHLDFSLETVVELDCLLTFAQARRGRPNLLRASDRGRGRRSG